MTSPEIIGAPPTDDIKMAAGETVTVTYAGSDSQPSTGGAEADEKAVSAAVVPAQDPDIVDFDGPQDPLNPRVMSEARKWALAASVSMITFTTVFASTIFSPATLATEASGLEFGYSNELMTLGTALFVTGMSVSCDFLPITNRLPRLRRRTHALGPHV